MCCAHNPIFECVLSVSTPVKTCDVVAVDIEDITSVKWLLIS